MAWLTSSWVDSVLLRRYNLQLCPAAGARANARYYTSGELIVSQIAADPISRAYLRLAFQIDQLVPGFIDAYFGPPEWRAADEADGAIPPADLRHTAEALLRDIASISDDVRREWG
jgi:hypothetical protein